MRERDTNRDNRWAVILGASSGTGAAGARAAARDPGFHIFGMHRGHWQEQADELVTRVTGLGRRCVLEIGDAGTADGARRGARALREIAGPGSVGLFVHSIANASVGPLTSADGSHITPQKLEKTMASMANSFVYWAQAFVELDLLAPRALLLGLHNPLCDSALANGGVIAASKAALERYIIHMAMELGPLGHRVNMLKFSTVVTPALSQLLGEDGMARVVKKHTQMHPAGRILTTEEVGRFVSLLCRDDARWFNGATIDFTGGMTQHLLELVMYPPDESNDSSGQHGERGNDE